MKHSDVIKKTAIYLFKLIIKQTEQRFAYLFAVFVFSGVLVLAILDKNLLYVSCIGAFCLFLLKLPEIILCCKGEQKITFHLDKQILDKKGDKISSVKEADLMKIAQKISKTLPDKFLSFLQKKYGLNQKQIQQIKSNFETPNFDEFLFQTQLESYGIEEENAELIAKGTSFFRISIQ